MNNRQIDKQHKVTVIVPAPGTATTATPATQAGVMDAESSTTGYTKQQSSPSTQSIESSPGLQQSRPPLPLNHHADYSDQNGPCLSLLWSEEEFKGQSLYLGGAQGLDGHVYCIPGNATRVLCIDTLTDRVYPIGPVIAGKFKWLRGIRVAHIIYGLPCHSPTVLRIDTQTQQVTFLDIPYETFYTAKDEAHQQRNMEWKYHGGSFSDTCIYCIPQSASHVLRIDTTTDVCSFLPSAPLVGRYKWYGGVVGKDGAIYGIPHNAASVLRIHQNQVTLHGMYPDAHKWHGAAVAGDGTIVCVPANANYVLCIEPASPMPNLYELHPTSPDVIRTGQHRDDGKYKYLGSTRGSNGCVYCFPSGSEYVLKVDTVSRSVENIGPNLVQMERMVQNKWQNGIRQGNVIYAIPLSAESVLRIDVTAQQPHEQVTTWRLPIPHAGLAKWEGAVLASNGVIYCMPNNHKAVLRIADTPSVVAEQDLMKDTGVDCCILDTASSAKTVMQPLRSSNCSLSATPTENTETPTSTTIATPSTEPYKYITGIPTLRSSAHRVKYSPKHRDASTGKGICLPINICNNLILDYDTQRYDFAAVIVAFLKQCDPNMVGSFLSDRLEDFQIPLQSLSRGTYGGFCEEAQAYLSQQLTAYDPFVNLFDEFVTDYILPHLKQRLLADGIAAALPDSPMTFYYQRPPTLRLQPGPARAYVKPHCDSEYGHQEGELNFWFPLTDRSVTNVDLHVESDGAGDGDCIAVPVEVGQILSFHGTSRKHFVNSNGTKYTRVSMDFRVGVEGFFDANWEMVGTTADHTRRQVEV